MFYYLLEPLLSYHFVLVAAAVIPALLLMIKVYRSDRLEKERPGLLINLVKAGVLSSLLALFEERVLSLLLGLMVSPEDPIYNVILYFGIVAFSEESSKYLFLKHHTWRSPEFDCQYDGVVYAVFVSLGFALWENISYVLQYGFSVAVIRAGTAIPGHACFGVFMGIFYGLARKYENRGEADMSKLFRILALLVPAGLHGAYDYIATMEEYNDDGIFLGFIIVLFAVSYILVNRMSTNDEYIA